jgi:hypothetical protein
MSIPTVFDFALVYPAPMSANVAREFDLLSDENRVEAVIMARRIAATARNFDKPPLGVLAFLAMKPWRKAAL